jgi:hypothetical protein
VTYLGSLPATVRVYVAPGNLTGTGLGSYLTFHPPVRTARRRPARVSKADIRILMISVPARNVDPREGVRARTVGRSWGRRWRLTPGRSAE